MWVERAVCFASLLSCNQEFGVVTEIMCGFPLWMSYKSRIKGGDGQGGGFLKGLFAASGRSADKIVRQQVR